MTAITGYTAVEARKGDSSGPYSGDSSVITTLSYLDATNVNDIWLVYQKDAPATGIKFKYFSLAQLRKNGIQGTKDDGTYGNDYAITPYNTIKYTVECYKRIAEGNDQWEYVLQDIPEDAVIPDFHLMTTNLS